jgi:hypothetical protein
VAKGIVHIFLLAVFACLGSFLFSLFILQIEELTGEVTWGEREVSLLGFFCVWMFGYGDQFRRPASWSE